MSLLLVMALAKGGESPEVERVAQATENDADWRRIPAEIAARSDVVVVGRVIENEFPDNPIRPGFIAVNVVRVDHQLKGEPSEYVRIRSASGVMHGATRLAPVGSQVLLMGSVDGEHFRPKDGTPFSYLRMTPEGLKNGDGRPMHVMSDGTFSVLLTSVAHNEVQVMVVHSAGTTPMTVRDGGFEAESSLETEETGIDQIARSLERAL